MLAEEQKLRWCGLDMRPRGRRRAAVVVTYVVLFVVCVTASGYENHPAWAMVGLAAGVELVVWLSVLRRNGIVKRFEPKPPIRMKGIGEVVLVEGLDGWAKHFYGAESFDAATEAQQADILSRFRMGPRWFSARTGETDARTGETDTPWLDEREVKERDSAERWSGRQMLQFLTSCGVFYSAKAFHHEAASPLAIAVEFLMFAVLAQTLPKARVLWTEDDPREGLGEMHLVDAT